jgi:DNA polymerase-1
MLIVRKYMKKKSLIFDGSNLLHRCFWVNSVRPTIGVEYLFLNSIKKLASRFKPDDILCVWDTRKNKTDKNYRQILTEGAYKQTRDREKSAKVYAYCDSVQQVSRHLGIAHLHPDVLEADDYIGWLTSDRLVTHNTVVVSSDSDLLQLCSPECIIYNPMKDLEITCSNFREITGTKNAKDFILFKSLMGDKSDNIEGLSGVGKKRALNLVREGISHLSATQSVIVNKNIELIDLSKSKNHHPHETDWYALLYDREIRKKELNLKKFREACLPLRLNNIIRNIREWEQAFDQTKTIENVVDRLIRLNLS